MGDRHGYEIEKTDHGWLVYQNAISGVVIKTAPVSREYDTREEAEAEIKRLIAVASASPL